MKTSIEQLLIVNSLNKNLLKSHLNFYLYRKLSLSIKNICCRTINTTHQQSLEHRQKSLLGTPDPGGFVQQLPED
jgi:hypothetical protein